MADEKYTDLHVLAVDGAGDVFYGMYKAMRVESFKRMIAIQSLGTIRSWEDIVLYCMETEMEDARTLESYGLQNGSIIRYILSPGAPRRGTKKQSVRQDAEVQPTEILPPPPYEPLTGLGSKELKTIFVRDIDTGRSQNVGPMLLGASIKKLRQNVSEKQGWPIRYVRMLFGAKELQDVDEKSNIEKTLMDYGIQDESTIHIVSRLPGGKIL